MNIGRRAILLLGDRSRLVDLNAGPMHPRVIAVHEDGPSISEPNELAVWLRTHLPRGLEVDVIYQQHLLTVETFPALDLHELPGALAVRLKRDMLVPSDGMTTHVVPLATVTHAQAVWAGVPSAQHLTVTRMLASAKMELGRLAYLGQLALAALKAEAPNGGWTTLTDTAMGKQTLLAVGPDGQTFASNYPPETDLRVHGLEIAKLHFPKLDGRNPARLGKVHDAKPMGGVRLPEPFSWAVPTMLHDLAWRVPSKIDIEYPHYFSNVTWGFFAALGMMFLYTGYQVIDLRDRLATAPEVQKITDQVTAASNERKGLEEKLGALDQLEKNTQFLQGELYSTDGWFHLVAELRDRVSPDLLFDSVSDVDDYIVVAGSTTSMEAIVRLYKSLVSRLGDDNLVKLYTIDREKGGKATYRLQLKRSTYMPPPARKA